MSSGLKDFILLNVLTALFIAEWFIRVVILFSLNAALAVVVNVKDRRPPPPASPVFRINLFSGLLIAGCCFQKI